MSYTPSIGVTTSAGSSGTTTSPSTKRPPGPSRLGDAREQIRLTGTVEVVHSERGDDEVEAALGERVLETTDPQVGPGDNAGRRGQHLGALVDADQLGGRMELEHPSRGLARADPELEHPLGTRAVGRGGDGVLELVVRGYLLADHVEVGHRIEVELFTWSVGHQVQSGR